ncbi:platelet-derived growth factor receptor beta-like [Macrobrachium rosenbergii]|uniref:platelet-derived growth factor receptor beta-like n=1 Tax=Macrobrachium rosenbergii TaxID=79674 RepID=UPI0034D658CA
MKLFCQILDNKFQSQPTFTWTLPNGRKVEIAPEYHSVQSHMYYTSYLRVPNVTLEDSGTYNCTVNIEGRSPLPATRDINIKENENPFLTVSTDTQNITCSTGEDVFWKLEVASFPPSFTLQSNSKIDHRQYPNGTCILEKKRATPSDFGEHTVTVTTNTSLGVKTEQVSL